MNKKCSKCCFESNSKKLSKYILNALLNSGFNKLVYYNNRDSSGTALPSPFLPQVDLSVIEISKNNKILAACNILYDRDHPEGYEVQLNRRTITANNQVSFNVWREERWINPELWNKPPAAIDVITNPPNPIFSFMLPYPASCLKTMIAFIFMTLVDEGKIKLNSIITYQETGCPPAPNNIPKSNLLSVWLTQMITISENFDQKVLLQYLYLNNELKNSQDKFNNLGLNALKFGPTLNPKCGQNSYDGFFGMGSIDTSKLLLIIFGVTGVLWTTLDGKKICADKVLSKKSQKFLQNILYNNAFAEVLNPVGLCGSPYKIQGFKTCVPPQFIGANNNLVVPLPEIGFILDFGYDMSNCLKKANTRFAHNTGLTDFAGGDHGYVSKCKKCNKKYIITIHTSAGKNFADPELANAKPNACDEYNICYSNAFPKIANYINKLLFVSCKKNINMK
jgi:hypothetical protein